MAPDAGECEQTQSMSYGRMGEAEQKLQAEVEALLRHAEEVGRGRR